MSGKLISKMKFHREKGTKKSNESSEQYSEDKQ